jgi:hypothetical protein
VIATITITVAAVVIVVVIRGVVSRCRHHRQGDYTDGKRSRTELQLQSFQSVEAMDFVPPEVVVKSLLLNRNELAEEVRAPSLDLPATARRPSTFAGPLT